MRSRRALVTAAASGLAAGIAAALARDDFARVAITYRTTPPQATLAAIRSAGAEASAYRVDFSRAQPEVAAALDEIVASAGPFDTLVHCVGPIVVKRFASLDADECREMIAGNLESAIIAARAVLPAMREARFGRIVFFGANGSSETRPARGFTVYGAAKSGVTAFARALALEEARSAITVNVVEPGHIRDTSLTRERAATLPAENPRGRPGSFEDVADVVRFLAARERDFVTGAVVGVTGGLFEADERNASSS
ncbi:MAG: SDR family NAD(P)-dependent oxidoreductase [Candidatus Tyrphobacter sp.]